MGTGGSILSLSAYSVIRRDESVPFKVEGTPSRKALKKQRGSPLENNEKKLLVVPSIGSLNKLNLLDVGDSRK